MTHEQNRILIVDDVKSSRVLLEQILTKEGYEVAIASSSNEALASLQTKHIELCVLDIDMPKMDGFELAEKLLTDINTQHIYLVFITGFYGSRSHRLKGYKLGAIDFIAKPLDRELLISKIKVYFRLINREKSLLRENHYLQSKNSYEQKRKQDLNLQKKVLSFDPELKAENMAFPRSKSTKYIENRDRQTLAKDIVSHKKAKSQFLSLISHELHTPLQAIIGFSQLLMLDLDSRTSFNADQRDSVQHIYQSGHQLLEQIDLLLELSHLKSGERELKFEKVDVGEVLDDLFPMMEELSNKHAITVSIKQREERCLYADYKKLKQLLKHLLINIFHLGYFKESIYIDFEYLDPQFLRILISEKADGLSHVQPFSLSSDNELVEGGIHFDIVQCLAEKMTGHFGFDTQSDIGGLFWLDLPAYKEN